MDRRILLKVKVKSLAEEARIIRREERKGHRLRDELYRHRTQPVRIEARHTLLAYGFLRGRSYKTLEEECRIEPNWNRIWRMVERYGVMHHETKTALELKEAKEQQFKCFDKWKRET